MAAVNSLKSLNNHSSDVSKSDLFKIAPHLILEEEGFNPRGAFIDDYFEQEDVKAHIRRLADAYKAGNYVPPMVVQVREGKVLLRDGHCRRKALDIAMGEGAEIRKVEVLEQKGDEAAQTALILNSNDGLKLSPLERAVIYDRRVGWGWSEKEIADEFGRTEAHVRQLLDMMDMPIELKRMVQYKKISAYAALEMFKEHGETAVEMVKKAAEKKDQRKDGGSKRVTQKDVAPKKRMTKKFVSAMQTSLTGITSKLDHLTAEPDGETYTLRLSKDEVEDLKKLRESLSDSDSDSEKK